MGLTTAQDLAVLDDWGLIRDYHTNKVALLSVGQAVFQAFSALGAPPQSAAEMEQPLTATLRGNTVFQAICTSKGHANPALYEVFARALARYIIDFEWAPSPARESAYGNHAANDPCQ